MSGYRTHEKESSEPVTPYGVEHTKAEEQGETDALLFSVSFGFAVSGAALPIAPAATTALAALSHPTSQKQRAAMLRGMQKRQGNAYVQSAVAQQKRPGSTVTSPQNQMEQEADRQADSVMMMPEDKITAQPPKKDTPKKQMPSGQSKSDTQAKTAPQTGAKKETKKTESAQSKAQAQQVKSSAADQTPTAKTMAPKAAPDKVSPKAAAPKSAAPKSAAPGQASGRRAPVAKTQPGVSGGQQGGASKSAKADSGAVSAGTPADMQEWSRKFTAATQERIGNKTPENAKGAAGPLNEQRKSQDAERKAGKTDYKAEAQTNIPPAPKVEEKPPVEIAPVMKQAQALIEEAANKRLSYQIMSSLQPTPGHPMINNGKGRMPVLDAMAALAESAERSPAEPPDADKDRAGKDKPREKQAGAEDKQMSAGAPGLITLDDEGPTPEIVIPDEQKEEMDKSIGASLTLLMSNSAEQASEIVKDAESAAYNGNLLNKLAPEIAKDHLDEVKQELEQELSGIADAAGLEGKSLKKIAEEQKKNAKAAMDAGSKESKSETDNARQQTQKTGLAQSQAVSAAGAAANAAILQKAKDTYQPPEPTTIEEKKNRMLQKILKDAAAARAAFRMAGQKRESELTRAGEKQSAAYSMAANMEAAEIKAFYKNDDKTARVQSRPSLVWGQQRVREVEDDVIQKKRSAAKQVTEFQALVDKKELEARVKIITWAHEQLGTEHLIALEIANTVDYWKEKAKADIEAWQKEINRRSKEALIADFALLVKLRDAKEQQNREGLEKIITGISEEQQGLVGLFFSSGENALASVAATMVMRIKARRVPALVEKLREDSVTKIQDLTILERLAQSQNREFSARALAIQIRKAIKSTFVEKENIFSALSGRTPVQMAAIRMAYSQVSGKGDMSTDVKSALTGRDAVSTAMSVAGPMAATTPLTEGVASVVMGDAEKDDDWKRAESAMKGDRVGEDVFALHGAMTGYVSDSDKASVMSILRHKTPAERQELFERYEKEHGKTLKEHLKKELEGLDKERAIALLEGDVEKSDAIAIHQAVKDKEDINAVDAVYEQVRKEVEAEAVGGTWTTAEVEAEVKRRADNLTVKHDARFAKGSTTDLHGLIFSSDLNPLERDLALAHMSGDRTEIDAAKLRIIGGDMHPSDQKINALLRAQLKRAETEVRRDNGVKKMELQVEASMRRMELLDKIAKEKRNPATLKKQLEEMEASYKAQLEQMDSKAEQEITDKAKKYLKDLETNYDAKDPKKLGGTGAFVALLKLSMSGNAEMIAEQIRTQGKLTDAQEIFYAIYDVGTDNSTLRQTLKDKTPTEVNEIEKQYEATFKGRSFHEDVMGEADSLQEEYEFSKLMEGVPQTMEGKKRRLERDREFESHPSKFAANPYKYIAGWRDMVGLDFDAARILAAEERGVLQESRTGAEKAYEDYKKLPSAEKAYEDYKRLLAEKGPNNEETRKAQEQFSEATKAQERFNILAGYTELDRERLGEAVDDITDKASMVAAIAAGLLVAAVTAGTASPAVVAALSAMASTSASIYTKAIMKGSGYDVTDIAQDVGIGAVDTAAAALTAGMGSALLKTRLLSALAGKGVIGKIAMTGLTEGVENVINGLPSGILSTALSEEVWQGDALDVILKSAITQSAMGFGMGFGMGSITAFKEHKMSVKAEAEARGGTHSSRPKAEASAHAGDVGAHPAAKADTEAHPAGRTDLDEPSAGRVDADAGQHAAARAEVESRVRKEPDLDAEITTHTVGDAPEAKLKEWKELESLQDHTDVARLKEGLLSGSLKDRVPIIRDPDLPGNTVLVHYDVVNGLVTNVRMRVGPGATAYDVYLHRQTAKLMYRYSGFSGKIFRLISRMEKWIAIHGQPPVGTLAWEAKLEIDKLPRIIEARMDELARGGLTREMQEQINDEIGYLRQQLAKHKRTLARMDLDPGVGFVAGKGKRKGKPVIGMTTKPVPRTRKAQKTYPRTIVNDSPLGKQHDTNAYQIGHLWQEDNRVYRRVEVYSSDHTVLDVQEEIELLDKHGNRSGHWQKRGSEGNIKGDIGEEASRSITKEEMDQRATLNDPDIYDVPVTHQIKGSGHGFDGVLVRFDGNRAEIIIIEDKNYSGALGFAEFSAIRGKRLERNWKRLTDMLTDESTFAPHIKDSAKRKKAMALVDAALKSKKIELQVRIGPDTQLGDMGNSRRSILGKLRREVKRRLAMDKVDVKKVRMDEATIAKAEAKVRRRDMIGERQGIYDLFPDRETLPTQAELDQAHITRLAVYYKLIDGPARASTRKAGRYFDIDNNPFTVLSLPRTLPKLSQIEKDILEEANRLITLPRSGQKSLGVLVDVTHMTPSQRKELGERLAKDPNAKALRDRIIAVNREKNTARRLIPKSALAD